MACAGSPSESTPTSTFCRCGSSTTPWPKSACSTGGMILRRYASHHPSSQSGSRSSSTPVSPQGAGQFVPGVLAHAVGDPHVEAELAEDVGHRVVNGADRRCGHHLPRPRPEIDEETVAKRLPQPRPSRQQPELPWMCG